MSAAFLPATITRRAAFGAVAIAPIALAAGSVSPDLEPAWRAAVAAFSRLHREHEAAADVCSLAEDAHFTSSPPEPCGRPFLPGDTVATFNARGAAEREQALRDDEARRRAAGVDEARAALDAACDRSVEALLRLMATAAPDLMAIATKIEIATEHDLDLEEIAGPIGADLRRLAGVGVAA